jgi:serine/threonine protein kinase
LAALHAPPGLSPNINLFHGVFFADFAQLPESLPGIPSIVVDFVKYDSLEYLAGKGFGVRLDIVSYWSFGGEIQGSFFVQVQQLGRGLLYMHSLGLVHGDMKPVCYSSTVISSLFLV